MVEYEHGTHDKIRNQQSEKAKQLETGARRGTLRYLHFGLVLYISGWVWNENAEGVLSINTEGIKVCDRFDRLMAEQWG